MKEEEAKTEKKGQQAKKKQKSRRGVAENQEC
jgi:hypothetical protein